MPASADVVDKVQLRLGTGAETGSYHHFAEEFRAALEQQPGAEREEGGSGEREEHAHDGSSCPSQKLAAAC